MPKQDISNGMFVSLDACRTKVRPTFSNDLHLESSISILDASISVGRGFSPTCI